MRAPAPEGHYFAFLKDTFETSSGLKDEMKLGVGARLPGRGLRLAAGQHAFHGIFDHGQEGVILGRVHHAGEREVPLL